MNKCDLPMNCKEESFWEDINHMHDALDEMIREGENEAERSFKVEEFEEQRNGQKFTEDELTTILLKLGCLAFEKKRCLAAGLFRS